jgi:hypothetical protein
MFVGEGAPEAAHSCCSEKVVKWEDRENELHKLWDGEERMLSRHIFYGRSSYECGWKSDETTRRQRELLKVMESGMKTYSPFLESA